MSDLVSEGIYSPNKTCKLIELHLGMVPKFHCRTAIDESTLCNKCDVCIFLQKLHNTKEWFTRIGRKYQIKFFARLILYCSSIDLLNRIIQLLGILDCKDTIYSVIRAAPTFPKDQPFLLPPFLTTELLSYFMADVWMWFKESSLWLQTNFLYGLLPLCDLPLLRLVRSVIQNLLAIYVYMFRTGITSPEDACYHFMSYGNEEKDEKEEDSTSLQQKQEISKIATETSDESEIVKETSSENLKLDPQDLINVLCQMKMKDLFSDIKHKDLEKLDTSIRDLEIAQLSEILLDVDNIDNQSKDDRSHELLLKANGLDPNIYYAWKNIISLTKEETHINQNLSKNQKIICDKYLFSPVNKYSRPKPWQKSKQQFKKAYYIKKAKEIQGSAKADKPKKVKHLGTTEDLSKSVKSKMKLKESLLFDMGKGKSSAYSVVIREILENLDEYRYNGDFIKSVPPSVIYQVIKNLDVHTLMSCSELGESWRLAVKTILDKHEKTDKKIPSPIKAKKPKAVTDKDSKLSLFEETTKFKETTDSEKMSTEADPNSVRDVFVLVPDVDPETLEPIQMIKTDSDIDDKKLFFKNALKDYKTRRVFLEIRNIYPGNHIATVILKRRNLTRVVHHDGSNLICIGAPNQKFNIISRKTLKPLGIHFISKAAESVRCLHLVQKEQIVFTGSYDTTVRCWSTKTGRCRKIFLGHTDTVLCLAVYLNYVAAGSKDGKIKVWDHHTQKFMFSFTDEHSVTAVALNDVCCVAGCERGSIRIFSLTTGEYVKQLNKHQLMITSIKCDRYFIISGSKDYQAMVWSSQGKFRKCLTVMKHPMEVTHVELLYLHVLTSCWDGKIRIWNIETGFLLKEIIPNHYSLDPVLSFHPGRNWIVVNTVAEVLVIEFDKTLLNYQESEETRTVKVVNVSSAFKAFKPKQHSSRDTGISYQMNLKYRRASKHGLRAKSVLTHEQVHSQTDIRKSKHKFLDLPLRPTGSWISEKNINKKIDVSLEKAKNILWSQRRKPYSQTPPEPYGTIIELYRKKQMNQQTKLTAKYSVDKLLDPSIKSDMEGKAEDLRKNFWNQQEENVHEVLHVFWKGMEPEEIILTHAGKSKKQGKETETELHKARDGEVSFVSDLDAKAKLEEESRKQKIESELKQSVFLPHKTGEQLNEKMAKLTAAAAKSLMAVRTVKTEFHKAKSITAIPLLAPQGQQITPPQEQQMLLKREQPVELPFEDTKRFIDTVSKKYPVVANPFAVATNFKIS